MRTIILTALSGLVCGFLGWEAQRLVMGDSGTLGPTWLLWVHDVGLNPWPPANLGGIVFCVSGAGLVARALGVRRGSAILGLVAIALVVWFVAGIALFYGLRVQDLSPDATGG